MDQFSGGGSVRQGDWKLVHFVDSEEGQLFNLSEDPQEKCNLWDDAEFAGLKQNLIMKILEWRIESDKKTQNFRRELKHG